MAENNDPILTPLLSKVSDEDWQNALSELLTGTAQPIIRKVLRSAFRTTLNPDQESSANQDALELENDVNARLIRSLNRLRNSASGPKIGNFEGYVTLVARNTFRQHLREKYPGRHLLRGNLLYLFEHHPEFSLWHDTDENVRYCGYETALSDPPSQTDPEAIMLAIRSAGIIDDSGEGLIRLARAIFDTAKGPLQFEQVVRIACAVKRTGTIHSVISLDDEAAKIRLPATIDNTEKKLELRQYLRIVWAEVSELPVRHAAALLLNLRDPAGDSMIRLFPVLGIATVRQIAKSLNISPETLASIWHELPWEDNKIAELLSIERQQVINLRSSARHRIKRRLANAKSSNISQ